MPVVPVRSRSPISRSVSSLFISKVRSVHQISNSERMPPKTRNAIVGQMLIPSNSAIGSPSFLGYSVSQRAVTGQYRVTNAQVMSVTTTSGASHLMLGSIGGALSSP